MKRKILEAATICLAVLALSGHGFAAASNDADALSASLRSALAKTAAAGEGLRARRELQRFYEARQFKAAWISNGRAGSDADSLLKAIDAVYAHGLEPQSYHQKRISELMEESKAGSAEGGKLAQLDLLLTDAFFALASNLSVGLVDPFSMKFSQFKDLPDKAIDNALESALAAHSVSNAVESFAPSSNMYVKLKDVLARQREFARKGGWPTVQAGDKIEPGATDARVAGVRARLVASGEFVAKTQRPDEARDAELYDDDLKQAVIRYQSTHGLTADGIIGKATVASMNSSALWRVCQARINLDRLRALNRILSEKRYIAVNVPDFSVTVTDGGSKALTMKAIVGRLDRKTPLMSNTMRFIVFSPQWHVPNSIAVKDKLPEIRKDPAFLKKHGMKLYASGEEGITEVDAETVDWTSVDSSNFSYRIVQRPGDDNALGRIKFMFPNKDDVYLHDTPTKGLFNNSVRTFSSGCIRIEKPVELAVYLLGSKQGWDRERIEKEMKRTDAIFVNLDEPIPIHILYLTAWADDDGTAQFREDIYGKDRAIAKNLCPKD